MVGSDKRLKYTLGFIYCDETQQVLLLNRNKSPWMGKWNGVGGKLHPEETPYQCIVRETKEETGLTLPQYEPRGVLLWEITQGRGFKDDQIGGLYLFTAKVSQSDLESYHTPKSFPEGILEWKSLDWVLHQDNLGIVDNIKILFNNNTIFNSNQTDSFKVTYNNHRLTGFIHETNTT